VGQDQFSYRLTDGISVSSVATVTIEVSNNSSGHTREQLQQALADATAELTEQFRQALDDRRLTREAALYLVGRVTPSGQTSSPGQDSSQNQGILLLVRDAQQSIAKNMQLLHSSTFYSRFFAKLREYVLDLIQNRLRMLELVLAFIPGLQGAAAGVGALNFGISLARGKYESWAEALFDGAFAVIPFVSSAAKFVQAGGLTRAKEFAGLLLRKGTQAAQRFACPVLTALTLGYKRFCFVEGTLVVVGEEWVALVMPAQEALADLPPDTLPPEVLSEDWDSLYLV
jgi:hypothetical protein